MAKKRHATIDDILATFSSHVTGNYPSPEAFQERLDGILAGKRERFEKNAYLASLETNVVFLHDLIIESEALIDVLFDGKRSKNLDATVIDDLLTDMEERVRGRIEQRRHTAFVEGTDTGFAELRELRSGDRSVYVEKLESTYRFLMTFKILFFEFFNVLVSIMGEHVIEHATPKNRRRIPNHIELTVNYYLGTVSVKKDGDS